MSGGTRSASDRPNVLFILTDDQGIGDLSLHGNDSIQTPQMDDLLRSAARFSHFYVSPVCAPTRASFLSGQYAPRTGAVYVTRRRETMDDEVVTLAEHLRAGGYRTGLFGKWHNGATFPYHPAAQGFDKFLGFTLGHFNDYFRGELRNERDAAVPFAGDLTAILTDSAARWIDRTNDAPFFAMLAYQAPHTPVQVADTFYNAVAARGLSPYNTGIYAMVESIDHQIGRLLSDLERSGRLDNTIVVFSTDNGPNGDRYRMGLRGTKGQVDEGSVRVPFGIRLPGGHPANGREFHTPAAHIDLLPTLLDYLGLPAAEEIDGKSLLPLLNDEPAPELENRYIYVFKQGLDFKPWPGSVRNDKFLYVRRGRDVHEFYDLSKDPGQRVDLFAAEGVPVDQLTSGMGMRAQYANFAPTVAAPDLVAPPIDLSAGRGTVRLLAHEGEPRGRAHFSDPYGWANDFFRDVGEQGVYWPVLLPEAADFTATIHYACDCPQGVEVSLATDLGPVGAVNLPGAEAPRLPVADRVARKEVHPRDWATASTSLRLPAGAREVRLLLPGATGGRSPLWVKEITLQRVNRLPTE